MPSKKGGRYKPNEELERFLKDTWLEEKSKGKDKTWYEIRGIALKKLAEAKIQVPVMPERRKVQMILKEARLEYDGIPQDVRKQIEEMGKPWTIGTKVDIPREAVPVVLRCWKEAQLLDASFTIREAKWCARLSALIKDSWVLRDWASVYANRELAYEILGKENEFDTSDFDILLTTPPWEFATGYLTGEIKPVVHGIFTFRKIGRRVVPTDKESSIFELPLDEKALVTIAVAPLVLHSHAFTAECEFLELSDLYPRISGNFPTTSFEEFSEEQIRVFVLWLHYLTKGPRIKSLKGETDMKKLGEELDRRKQIIHELHEWVKSHRLAKDSACLGPVVPHKDVLDFLASQYNLKPVELLKKVGYEA